MTFAYASDGIPSYQEIEDFNNNVLKFPMVSELAYDGGGFHALGEAVDFSDGGDAGTQQMDAGAAAWLQYYPFLLELIHVNQDGSMIGVKNGQIVDALSFYGAPTMAQHKNHYHVAATRAGIKAAIAAGPAASGGTLGAGGFVSGTVSGNSLSNAWGAMEKLVGSLGSAAFWERVGIGLAGVVAVILAADILRKGLA
jgi:hypothetical protein